MARAGDLILVLCYAVARSWKQIIYYQPSDEQLGGVHALAGRIDLSETDLGGFDLPSEVELVRDSQGVRLPREGEPRVGSERL